MEEKEIFVEVVNGYQQIDKIMIGMIKYEKEKCKIITLTEEFEVRRSLAEIEKMLGDKFIRCTPNILINISHIRNWDIVQSKVFLYGGHEIKVSTRAAKKLNRILKSLKI